MRRSQLMAWILLGLLIVDILLLPLGINDPTTLGVLLSFATVLLFSIVLNRVGWVTIAALLLVILLCAAVFGDLLTFPTGLTVDALPAYDLLVIAVVVAASVLPRAAAFGVALANSLLIGLDFILQPHAPDMVAELAQYGDVTTGTIAVLVRPIGLEILIAVVAYLWVRGIDAAIRRADRAEELAALEHQLAEQKRQLDIGVQELLATHIRAANGDFSARAPLRQENILWQIASSLNNLLARMQRTAQAEHRLARTEEELKRIAGAIDEARAGRPPFWPMPTGTAADLILERIARDGRRAAVPTAPTQPLDPRAFPGGFGVAAVPSRAAAGSPYGPGYGQSAVPAAPSQPFDPRGFPGGFGAPVPPSMPFGQSPLGQSPRSQAPQGPASQANDLWPQTTATEPAKPSASSSPVPPAPWMLSQDELARDTQDRPQDQARDQARDRSQSQPQDAPPDWPELPPVGQWTIPTDHQ